MKQWTIIILILILLGWRLAVPVDFVRSDLGYCIKSGELILKGNWDLLHKNFYSYTNPEYPLINHHWLFGVFCFVLWHYFGFTGLSFIYLILELLTFYLFFRCWQRYSSFTIACAFALLSFPFISLRNEIRPEGISYLFCALFWWMIDGYQQKRIRPAHLTIALCVLQIIWVNTHMFFVMGPILAGLFWWQARINKEEGHAEVLQKLFFCLLGMCFINPSGVYGVLAPFYLNKLYSYQITEDLSVFYSLRSDIFPFKPLLIYFLAAVCMLIAGLLVLVQKEGVKKYAFIGTLTFFLSLAGMIAIRMIGLFGYFWIPLSMYVFSRMIKDRSPIIRKKIEMALVVIGAVVALTVNVDWKQVHGLGVVAGSNEAAQFFKEAKIVGPIFNNYSIGSYLIFHLSPGHKLFVDNRLEAYPKDFFKKTFIPLQTHDEIWQELDRKYHFNVIFYSPDKSDWEGGFVERRLMDPTWGMVFHNDQAVIFLRCNAQNLKLFGPPFCRPNKISVDI